jgi:hypothetical protein
MATTALALRKRNTVHGTAPQALPPHHYSPKAGRNLCADGTPLVDAARVEMQTLTITNYPSGGARADD